MKYVEDTFRSSDDRLNLCRHTWQPKGDVHGLLVFAHGILEHGQRHGSWASRLADAGIAVTALDHRGHGVSEGSRAWIDHFDQLLDDFTKLIRLSREAFPNVPTFMMGFSMGGAVVAQTWLARRPPVDGLILMAPALETALFPRLQKFSGWIDKICPRLRLFDLGASRKISRDPKVIEAFQADPRVYHKAFPIHIAAEVLRVSREVNRHFADFDLPFLLLHGTGDVITGIEGCRRMYRQASSTDKTLNEYPEGLHDLLHEQSPMCDQVCNDLLQWLQTHIEQIQNDGKVNNGKA